MVQLKGPQDQKGDYPREPKIQLQSLRGRLAVIAYRKWNFKILRAEKKFYNSEERREIACARYPKETENVDGVWRVLGPRGKPGEREINRENR